ncbi:MAG: N-acetyltransferase family protein [Oligoflexales bacterium]
MEVRPLVVVDSRILAMHIDRNSRLSGHQGIEYSILELKDLPLVSQLKADIESGMMREVGEVSWARFWVLKDAEDGISGHLYLKGSPYRSSRHRCRLGMGIEPAVRGRGFGEKLISEAFAWLKTQAIIEWVELYVFEHNLPAIKLYEKMGFGKVGIVQDLFRVNGHSINDAIMTLRLK